MNYQFDSHIIYRLNKHNNNNDKNNTIYKNIANNFYNNLQNKNTTVNTVKKNISYPYLDFIIDCGKSTKKKVRWSEDIFILETYSKHDYDRKIDGQQILQNRAFFSFLKNNHSETELNIFMELY